MTTTTVTIMMTRIAPAIAIPIILFMVRTGDELLLELVVVALRNPLVGGTLDVPLVGVTLDVPLVVLPVDGLTTTDVVPELVTPTLVVGDVLLEKAVVT